MTFELSYSNQARKFLKNCEKVLLKRIFEKLENLRINPFPSDSKNLKGYEKPTFRVRVGKYRIIYEVKEKELVVLIVKIDKRDKVYD